MGRPPLPEGEAKTEPLSVRLTTPVKSELVDLSTKLGVSKSNLAALFIEKGLREFFQDPDLRDLVEQSFQSRTAILGHFVLEDQSVQNTNIT